MSKVINRPAANDEPTYSAEKSQGRILGEGDHLVTIESVQYVDAPANENWNDQTPQLAVKYKNDEGSITSWLNRRGYVTFDELSPKDKASGNFEPRGDAGYAVDIRNGKNTRIEDPERTAKGVAYIKAMGVDVLGLAKGTTFKASDLVNEEVGIHVERNQQGNLRVMYTMSAEKVTA